MQDGVSGLAAPQHCASLRAPDPPFPAMSDGGGRPSPLGLVGGLGEARRGHWVGGCETRGGGPWGVTGPACTASSSRRFTEALVTIRNRHNDVVPTMAQGVLEYKDTYGDDPVSNQNIQYFLDRFYLSRISIRMLINQHSECPRGRSPHGRSPSLSSPHVQPPLPTPVSSPFQQS